MHSDVDTVQSHCRNTGIDAVGPKVECTLFVLQKPLVQKQHKGRKRERGIGMMVLELCFHTFFK